MDELLEQREKFFEERIRPHILPKAEDLVEKHRASGDCLVIVTATLQFVTEPIAAYFGIENLIAPVPEIKDNRYTGEVVGIPSFREGKVIRLRAWMDEASQTLDSSSFYSDSMNDLPLLELVDHPVAVDPDPTLRRTAEERGWPIISLRA
jgi:HAD superfamily hydrolase (TIGR01490 family)